MPTTLWLIRLHLLGLFWCLWHRRWCGPRLWLNRSGLFLNLWLLVLGFWGIRLRSLSSSRPSFSLGLWRLPVAAGDWIRRYNLLRGGGRSRRAVPSLCWSWISGWRGPGLDLLSRIGLGVAVVPVLWRGSRPSPWLGHVGLGIWAVPDWGWSVGADPWLWW